MAVQKNLWCTVSNPAHRIRYYLLFLGAIPILRVRHPRVTHQSAALMSSKLLNPARLACLRRAASVRSEPGSNSPWLFQNPEGYWLHIKFNQAFSYLLNWFTIEPQELRFAGFVFDIKQIKMYVCFVSFPELSKTCFVFEAFDLWASLCFATTVNVILFTSFKSVNSSTVNFSKNLEKNLLF